MPRTLGPIVRGKRRRSISVAVAVALSFSFAVAPSPEPASAAGPFTRNPACSVAPINGGHFAAAPSFDGVSAATATDAWAVGNYPVNSLAGIAAITDHWDGSRWQVVYPQSIQNASGFNGVAARTPSDVWAVGFGGLGTLVEHFNGTAWSIVPSPHIGGSQNINDFDAVAAFAPGVAFAVGHTGYQESGKPLVERWNGSTWSVVTTSAPTYGGLQAICGSSSGDVWTVGADGAGRPLVLHFNGTAWQGVTVPVPTGAKFAAFIGVLDRTPSDVWAVGGFTLNGNLYHNLIEHWNGTAWSIVMAPDAPWLNSQSILAISATAANDAWAVGEGPVALHWDGTAWTLIDSQGKFPAASVFAGAVPSGTRTLIAGYDTENKQTQLFAVAGCR